MDCVSSQILSFRGNLSISNTESFSYFFFFFSLTALYRGQCCASLKEDKMSSVRWPLLCSSPPSSQSTKFSRQFTKSLDCSLFLTNQLTSSLQLRRSATLSHRHSCKIFCNRSETTQENGRSQGFSVLQGNSPWQGGNLWSTFAFYMFILHIPLSFGGLSVVAQIIGKNSLVPQTEILGVLFIQIIELNGAFLLLKYTAKPQCKLSSFFKNNKSVESRKWVLASAVGFGVLLLLLFLTSLIASRLFGPKPVNSSILKEIILSGDISRVACVIVYCIVCPILEEVIYRGFLLTSLSSTMEWPQAVAVSSAIFSAGHFSGETFVQLFIIGWVLGCSYCWTGNLKSPLLIHSLHNALTLIISYLY